MDERNGELGLIGKGVSFTDIESKRREGGREVLEDKDGLKRPRRRLQRIRMGRPFRDRETKGGRDVAK